MDPSFHLLTVLRLREAADFDSSDDFLIFFYIILLLFYYDVSNIVKPHVQVIEPGLQLDIEESQTSNKDLARHLFTLFSALSFSVCCNLM